MEYFLGIIILLGVLIFFHEFGHFIVAKMCGVKVEVFSLGFGTKLIKKKVGETEYCLSLIPLGGYVKLYGEDPTNLVKGKDAKRSFANQSVSKRIAIAAAGPLFNILFAIIVYFVIEVGGLEKVIVPTLAVVQQDSVAWTAGLRSGDKILQLNGKPIESWQKDFLGGVSKLPGRKVVLTYERDGEPYQTDIVIGKEEAWSLFCEREEVGTLKGLSVRSAAAVVGIANSNSWAAKAGFQTGDRILSIENQPVTYWHHVTTYMSGLEKPRKVNFKVLRGEAEVDITLLSLQSEYNYLKDPEKGLLVGLHSYEFFVREPFEPETAGFQAGLKVGDRLVAINEAPIQSWDAFRESVQYHGKTSDHFDLTFERQGELHTTRLVPKEVASSHPCEEDKKAYQIGIVIDVNNIYPPVELVTHRTLNPVKALYIATSKSFFMMYLVSKSILKMIQGKISVKSMGGPILIGKVAGDHLKQGLLPFLALLAAISINLAILNLFPIPVLDGGHLLFFFYEAIFRRRPSEKVLEVANKLGLVIILSLVVLAFYNDISRYWDGISGFFKGIFGLV